MQQPIMERSKEIIHFWNQRDLKPPLMVSCRLLGSSPVNTSLKLAGIFRDIITILDDEKEFNYYGAVLLRLVFRMKKVFRNDQGFKSMQMDTPNSEESFCVLVHGSFPTHSLRISESRDLEVPLQCLLSRPKSLSLNVLNQIKHVLLNYKSFKIGKIFTELNHCTYESKGPTKQMMQFALVSLQRFAALLHRLYILCLKAANFFKERFQTGHHWNVAVICIAVISKLWGISINLLRNSCKWYLQLKNYLEFLQNSDDVWLPTNHCLPSDLTSWIGFSPDLLEKLKLDDKQVEKHDEKIITPVHSGLYFNEDIGEPVVRCNDDGVESNSSNLFTTTKQFLEFLRTEKEQRTKNRRLARTKHFNKKDWKEFHEEVMAAVLNIKVSSGTRAYEDALAKANKLVLNAIG